MSIHTRRVGRRPVLRGLGAVGAVSIAGCLGDESEDDESTENEIDAEVDDTEGTEASGEVDAAETEGAAEEATEIRPSDLDLVPDDAWAHDHPDVEIPDEPGRAVLVLGEERFEMDGDFSGGPREELSDIVREADEFEGDGVYFLMDGIFQVTDESKADHGLEEAGYNVRFFRRMVGWSGNELRYINSDEVEIWWPGITELTKYVYREAADGSVEGGDAAAATYNEEPFLRVDPSGVLTAIGTIDDPGQAEIPAGTTFEFGARADERWTDRWGSEEPMRRTRPNAAARAGER